MLIYIDILIFHLNPINQVGNYGASQDLLAIVLVVTEDQALEQMQN